MFYLFRFKIVSIFLFLGMFVYACGVVPRDSAPYSGIGVGSASIAASSTVSGFDLVVQQLYGAHSEWEGTPYVLGGNGMNGVDCSAFTQMVYREYFGQNLPRNTREQLQDGAGVRRNSIRPGDLIFFRTNRGVLHVGIAIEDGDFLHASVSSGVMISNLSENYWAGRFLGVRRVL